MDLPDDGKPINQIANLSEQVYRQMKRDLLQKKIKLGAILVEQELCQKYDVSRTPVREAIQMLNADGIVTKRKNHSTRIMEMSKSDAKHLISVRMELELVSVVEIAAHFTDEDYEDLMQLQQRCISALEKHDLVDLFEMDSQFHLELARRSGNTFLKEAYKKIDSKVQLLRSIEYSESKQILPILTMHSSILDCLRGEDLEGAIDLMRKHVLASDNFIILLGAAEAERVE